MQGWGGGNDLMSAAQGVGAGWLVHSGVVGGGNGTLYKDGVQVAQFAHAYQTVLTKMVIGQDMSGAGSVGMDAAAVLIYDRALSDVERANVETYLRGKYLQNSAPTVAISAPGNASTHSFGAPVTFTASASDDQDNPATLTAAIHWSSNLDGAIGTGGSFSTSTLSLGTHTITASVTDSGSMLGSASVTITVADMTPPLITVPANLVVDAAGAGGAIVNFTTSALDNVSGVVPTINLPASGSLFPLGVTTVNVTATDGAGNVGNASFTVTVRDTSAPVLTVPANMVVEAAGAGGAIVNFTTSALDDVSGVVPTINLPASGSLFPLGVTTVNVTAMDGAGNVGNASFTVTVRDTTAPVITVPANMAVEAAGASGAIVSFTTSAFDNISGVVPTINLPASGILVPARGDDGERDGDGRGRERWQRELHGDGAGHDGAGAHGAGEPGGGGGRRRLERS